MKTKSLAWLSVSIIALVLLSDGLSFTPNDNQAAVTLAQNNIQGQSISYTESSSLDSAISSIESINVSLEPYFRKAVSKQSGQSVSISSQELASLQASLQKRKIEMLKLAKENPVLFLRYVIPKSKKTRLPSQLQNLVEDELVTKGTLNTIHEDDFKNNKSKFIYEVKIGNLSYDLFPTYDLDLVSSSFVALQGYRLEKIIVADRKKVKALSIPKPDSVGEQKILVVLADFPNSTNIDMFTKEQVKDAIMKEDIQKFYKEQSYNRMNIAADVVGWVRINNYPKTVCNAVRYSDMPDIERQYNLDINNYDHIVFVTPPSMGYGGCATVGKVTAQVAGKIYNLGFSWVGGYEFKKSAWYEWNKSLDIDKFEFVFIHELGHSLGVLHANALSCSEKPMAGNCNHYEYGNYYDAMGFGRDGNHFNAAYKNQLGWINSDDIQVIRSSGRYNIQTLESEAGKKMALIKNDALKNPSYALEFREPLGYDNSSRLQNIQNSGLHINQLVYNKDIANLESTRLLDMSTGQTFFYDGLREGGIFKDLGTGISISDVVIKAGSVDFNVNIGNPECVQLSPGLSEVYGRDVIMKGSQIPLWKGIIFHDWSSEKCASKQVYKIGAKLPTEWSAESQRVEINSDTFGQINTYIKAPSNAAAGVYKIGLWVENEATKMKSREDNFTVQVVNPVQVTDVSPKTIFTTGERIMFTVDGLNKDLLNIVDIKATVDDLDGRHRDLDLFITPGDKYFIFPDKLKRYDNETLSEVYEDALPGIYRLFFNIHGSQQSFNIEYLGKPVLNMMQAEARAGAEYTLKGENFGLYSNNRVEISDQGGFSRWGVTIASTSKKNGNEVTFKFPDVPSLNEYYVTISSEAQSSTFDSGIVTTQLVSDPVKIKVAGAADKPVIKTINGPKEVYLQSGTYTWDAEFVDADSNTLKYVVDWGDRSKNQGTKTVAPGVPLPLKWVRNFTKIGNYTATVTVTDEDGASAVATFDYSVKASLISNLRSTNSRTEIGKDNSIKWNSVSATDGILVYAKPYGISTISTLLGTTANIAGENTFTFKVPDSFEVNKTYITELKTLDGLLLKNGAYFTVKAPPPPPVLPLKAESKPIKIEMVYDDQKKEVELIVEYLLKIYSGPTDISIPNPWGIGLSLRNSKGYHGDGQTSFEIYEKSAEIAEANGQWNNKILKIPAKTNVELKVRMRYNPKIMFADRYFAKLDSFYIEDPNLNWKQVYISANTISNRITVIGEQAPYITLATIEGSNLLVKGQRFNPKENEVQISMRTNDISSERKTTAESADGVTLSVPLNRAELDASYLLVTVTNMEMGEKAGLSNGYWISVVEKSPKNISKPAGLNNAEQLDKIKSLQGMPERQLQGASLFGAVSSITYEVKMVVVNFLRFLANAIESV